MRGSENNVQLHFKPSMNQIVMLIFLTESLSPSPPPEGVAAVAVLSLAGRHPRKEHVGEETVIFRLIGI